MDISSFESRVLSPADGFQKERVRPIDVLTSSASPFWAKSEMQGIYPCSVGVVYDKLHGYRVLARCGKWTCDYCGRLRKGRLQKEIQGLRERHKGLPVFTVLTLPHKDGKVIGKSGKFISDATVKEYVSKFCKEAQSVVKTRAYFKGWEPHKDGSPHCNIMWFGVRRDFNSCPIKNKRDEYDMRLQCGICDACAMRRIWHGISGASRSTHTVATGKTASYITKYVTKTTDQQYHEFFERFPRFSFSRGCKRTFVVLPVYRYIGNWLRHAGMWQWGIPEKSKTRNVDYLTDYYLFTRNETKMNVSKINDWQGYLRYRKPCAVAHENTDTRHVLCLPSPYWSPNTISNYGGVDDVWTWFGRSYGEDTRAKVIGDIKRTVNTYKELIL